MKKQKRTKLDSPISRCSREGLAIWTPTEAKLCHIRGSAPGWGDDLRRCPYETRRSHRGRRPPSRHTRRSSHPSPHSRNDRRKARIVCLAQTSYVSLCSKRASIQSRDRASPSRLYRTLTYLNGTPWWKMMRLSSPAVAARNGR